MTNRGGRIRSEQATMRLPNDASKKNAAAGPHATRLLLNVLMVEAVTYVCARFDLAFRVQPYHIALYRRLWWYAVGKVKSAFYVASSDAAHYARLHALLTDHSPLQVSIFTELEAAAKWLDVPIETLLARR